MIKRVGKYTLKFTEPPLITAFASVAGKFESEGPLKDNFDKIIYDSHAQKDTFEEAESTFQQEALSLALSKWGSKAEEVDFVLAGDLLNQCIASSFGLKAFGIPFLGQYGACSTSAQNLIMAAIFTEGKAAKVSAAVTSSHYCSAERQFRFPLEYGAVRTPTSQRTVTGSAAFIVENPTNPAKSSKSSLICPEITAATVGVICDQGVKDANNMGAAMAPAAADTLLTYFRESGESPDSFDYILTGDLGFEGNAICRELLSEQGLSLGGNFNDCGMMIFDQQAQDTHSGGSGCGCSAVVLGGFILGKMRKEEIRRVLLVGTGALMSPSMIQQGKSIAGIGHLVQIEMK